MEQTVIDTNKSHVRDKYLIIFEEHIKDSAAITGLTITLPNGSVQTVEGKKSLEMALLANASAFNVKRACFILHYAPTEGYKRVHDKILTSYFEPIIMLNMSVCYTSNAECNKKGCVERYGSNLYNQMFDNIKHNIKYKNGTTFVTRTPKQYQCQPAGSKGGEGNVFYVSYREGPVTKVSCKGYCFKF
jgi:hypothetical protein